MANQSTAEFLALQCYEALPCDLDLRDECLTVIAAAIRQAQREAVRKCYRLKRLAPKDICAEPILGTSYASCEDYINEFIESEIDRILENVQNVGR
jgi:hypothetical protein